MATSKERKNQLLTMADETIRSSAIYSNGQIISESYNGQIAAFSVTVALSGLKPALALYYSNTGSSEIDKRKIIDLLACMYSKDKNTNKNGKEFYQFVIDAGKQSEADLRKEILAYAIALKLIVRTFKFKK